MDAAGPDPGSSKRRIIDQLADAVETGNTDAKARLGQRLLDLVGEGVLSSWRFVEDGIFVPFSRFDPANMSGEDVDRLCEEQIVSATREPLIMDGAPLVGKEFERWHEIVAERALDAEFATCWVLLEFRHRAGRVLFVGATHGAPDPGKGEMPPLSFVTACSTYSETMNALKGQGFVGPKDYRSRSTQVFALGLFGPG